MSVKPIAFAAVAAAALFAQVAAPDVAHAGRGRGKHIIEQHYVMDGPGKGFSGFAAGYYCDYQRIPNRQCVVTPSGRESCKIVNWTLKQVCY